MSISQPQATDPLSAPDHAALHRIIAADTGAGNQSIVVNSSGYLGIGEASPATLLELSSTVPYITLHNTTHEDTDYGRESEIRFKGEQSGGEETTLGIIQVGHDATADNEKGIMTFKINDGDDGDAPNTKMTIDSSGQLILANGSILADSTASGILTLGGTGETNNENLTLDFESAENRIIVNSTTSGILRFDRNVMFNDDISIFFGQAGDEKIGHTTEGNDHLQLGLKVGQGGYAGYFSIMEQADMGNVNRSPLSTSANPVLRVYSSDVAQANDYIEMYHDQSASYIRSGNGNLIFDTAGNFIYFQDSATTGLCFGVDVGIDQAILGLRDQTGNQLVVMAFPNRTKDFDHALQTDPTLYIHSDTTPNIRNNEWGSEHHDKQNYIITSGAQIGAGIGVAQACTATNATNLFTDAGHILSNTDRIMIGGDAVPTGVDSTVIYYVISDTTDTFQISLTSGGAAVTFSDDGTNVTWSYASENAIVFSPRGTAQGRFAGAGGLHIKETTTPSAIADWGAIYPKSDNILYFQDGAGVEHALSCCDSYYGEMYQASNATVTTIDTADEWHAIRLFSTGEISGWTFDAGSTGPIASIADASGGDVTINDVAHGLSAGDMISITGTTNYNGLYEVKTAATNSFTITATWGASETGTWNQGSSLTANTGSAGKYITHFSVTLTSETNNHIFTFATIKNATDCSKCRARQRAGNAGDYHSISSTSIHVVSDGDKIYLGVKNIGANGNVTIRHANVNLERL